MQIRIPFWVQSGKNFIWYRKVRKSRNYHDARWVHYLTIFSHAFKWETK